MACNGAAPSIIARGCVLEAAAVGRSLRLCVLSHAARERALRHGRAVYVVQLHAATYAACAGNVAQQRCPGRAAAPAAVCVTGLHSLPAVQARAPQRIWARTGQLRAHLAG